MRAQMRRLLGRRSRWVIFAVCVPGVLAFAGWRALPYDRLLLDAAQAIAPLDSPTDAADKPSRDRSGEAYKNEADVTSNADWPDASDRVQVYWLSADRALLITTDHKPDLFREGWQGRADLLNEPTRTKTRLTGLTCLFNTADYSPVGPPKDFMPSPDGKWLHWQNQRQIGSMTDEPALGTLDGRRHRDLPREEYEDEAWLDNTHYVCLGSPDLSRRKSDMVVFDVQAPEGDRHYAVSSPQAKSILKRCFGLPDISCNADESGAVTIGLYRGPDLGNGPQSDIPDETLPVVLPQNSWLIRAYLSPERNRFVYDLLTVRRSPIRNLLHRFWPAFSADSEFTEGLWVCDQEGRGLHEIGHLPWKNGEGPGRPQIEEQSVQWLPGGRKLSFVFNRTLYTIPVR